jgi:hypothetical protein
MDNESRILKAIMERYGSLTVCKACLNEDEDTVLLNLATDLNDEISEQEILDYLTKILG